MKESKTPPRARGLAPRDRSRAPTETRPQNKASTRAPALEWRLGGYCRGYQLGVSQLMYITRLPVHRSRPPTRRSNQSHAQSSTTAASKTEMASSESVRARAPATIEYGNGLERTRRRRAQGRRPPPDTRAGTRAFNAPVVFSPNMPVTGSVIWNRHPSHHSFCSLPHQTTQSVSGRGK